MVCSMCNVLKKKKMVSLAREIFSEVPPYKHFKYGAADKLADFEILSFVLPDYSAEVRMVHFSESDKVRVGVYDYLNDYSLLERFEYSICEVE